MDEIEKLFLKMPKKDRQRVSLIISNLIAGQITGLQIKKLKNSEFCRVKTGRYRIIFTIDSKIGKVTIRDVKLRNESTYK